MQGRESDNRELLVWAIRRSLGISVALFAFYLVVPFLWNVPPLSTRDVLAILAVCFVGVWLGIGFSTVWPVPREQGLPRVFRTVVLTIPALGIGMAVHVTIEGAEGARAFYVMFALAAWLGSLYIEGDEPEAGPEEGTAASEG